MCQKSFSIQFAGTGNAWSKPPINYNTNALIHVDGKIWLLDCGLLCPLALQELNIPQQNIAGIYISHLHGDHALGLEELLFYNYFAHHRKLDLFIPADFFTRYSHVEGSDIWDNCLRASMESWDKATQRMLKLDDYADVHPMFKDRHYDLFGLSVQLLPVEHTDFKPTFGLILDRRVAFTSDCTFSRERIDKLFHDGIQTLFHEVTFAPPKPESIHTAFDEIATLPREYAERIYLMHYGDKATPDDFKRALDRGFHIAKRGEIYPF